MTLVLAQVNKPFYSNVTAFVLDMQVPPSRLESKMD